MSLLRRRVMIEEMSMRKMYPFYSDYPIITEYGVYFFDSQSASDSVTNVFLKMDDTNYNYCGGAPLSRDFYIEYTEQGVTGYRDAGFREQWFKREQASSSFSLKRCAGTESAPPLVIFKIDKI